MPTSNDAKQKYRAVVPLVFARANPASAKFGHDARLVLARIGKCRLILTPSGVADRLNISGRSATWSS
jgi:hypothetical protein